MLWSTVRTFFTSESGYVGPRAGLSFGWGMVVLVGILVLQALQPALADYCYGIPEGQCGWITVDDCYPNPSYIQEEWCNSPSVGCYTTRAQSGVAALEHHVLTAAETVHATATEANLAGLCARPTLTGEQSLLVMGALLSSNRRRY